MDNLIPQLQTYAQNFQSNISHSFTRLEVKDYIRLVIVIGAYALLRPYLVKLGARFQAKDHDRDLDPNELSSGAAVSPNSLRGQVQVPEDSSDSEEDEAHGDTAARAKGTGADWGKKARRRQRAMIRRLVEAEEKRKADEEEADSDKDIEEFLVEK
ncbi:hypothetical protein MMC09_006103 [Bachmanniomyces sp. S44760]|nr:hypothetical protein [Bachmanniomyces sp. S44760]